MPKGEIPFRLRIGVTGHRDQRVLANEEGLVPKVREAVGRARRLVPDRATTPVLVTVVSSLAEGADRLVAREVLKSDRDALLEAPLPLPRARYRSDFESESSVREFDELLEQPTTTAIEPVSASDPEAAYLQVGRYVVDRCDVLLALWDGLPARGVGGTGEIVRYARERKKPVIWIRTNDDHEIVEELAHSSVRGGFERLDEFNRLRLPEKDSAAMLKDVRDQDIESGAVAAEAIGRDEAEALSAWIFPYLRRADALALRFQRWFYWLTLTLYFAAAAAVAVVAVQSFVFPEHSTIVWIEVGLLVLLVLVVFYGRRLRLQRRWLSYRFLAERFRSAFFLAAAGLGQRLEGGLESAGEEDSAEEWVQRAFTEVWNRRPSITSDGRVERLRHFLAERWIAEQQRYYAGAQRRFARRHQLLLAGIYAAFLTTIVAAVLHARGVGEEDSEGKLFSILSLTLPALGAAFSGLLAQREYQRNSDRYAWMQRSLETTEKRMRDAADEAAVRKIAAEAETTLLEENRDWVGVMRFHNFELA